MKELTGDMSDKMHFRASRKVEQAFAQIIADQMHLALLHGAFKELTHGKIKPWGPHKADLTTLTDYKLLWNDWPKDNGIGIPGPGYWRDFRPGVHSKHAKLLRSA